MKKIAIVVATEYGQTKKIALFMRDCLERRGLEADIFVVSRSETPDPIVPAAYDGVLIGCPVYVGKFAKPLVAWTQEHADELNQMMTAFFSVSLNVADHRPQARQTDANLLRAFMDQTGLKPVATAAFAGALLYTQYGFVKRWLMKRISATVGGPTDTSKDYEMTDWQKVSSFVVDIVEKLNASLHANAATG